MLESEKLREQAAECRRFAAAAVDAEIVRKLKALADEYESRAVKAEANVHCKVRRGGSTGDVDLPVLVR
jgi:hypothetical protein